MNRNWDQHDFQTATETLALEADRLENTLRAAGKNVPARPVSKADASTMDKYDALTAHMAQLHALVNLVPTPPAPAQAAAKPVQPEATAKKKLTADGEIAEFLDANPGYTPMPGILPALRS